MGLPCNGGDNAPTSYLMPTRKTSSAKNRLHFIESLAKGVSQTSNKYHTLLSRVLVTLHNRMGKTLSLKTQFIYVVEHRVSSWCPTRSFTFRLVFMVLESTLFTTGGDKLSAPNFVICLQDILVQQLHKHWRINHHVFVGFNYSRK